MNKTIKNKILLAAGTAAIISIGALVPAQALPTVNRTVVIDPQNVHQATFWRWRYWNDGWRWRHRHHWRRWHRW